LFSTDLATNGTRDTTISINAQVQQLAKVDVKGSKTLPSWMERSGFDARKIQGMGAFATQAEIGRHGFSDLSSVLQGMRGIHIDFGGPFPVVAMIGGAARCNPNWFLDGVEIRHIKTAAGPCPCRITSIPWITSSRDAAQLAVIAAEFHAV